MKKKIIIITFLILTLIAGLLIVKSYVDYNNKKDPFLEMKNDDFQKRFVTFSDFTMAEEGDSIIYDSEKAKIALKVSNDWELIEEDFGFVSLKTKNFVPFDNDWKNKPLAAEGCWIDVNFNIERVGDDYQNIANEYIKNEQYVNNDEDETEQIIDLGYSKAVRSVFESKELEGEIVSIDIPNNNITYHFDNYLFGKDKERCEKDFDIFLASLAIKYIDENQ